MPSLRNALSPRRGEAPSRVLAKSLTKRLTVEVGARGWALAHARTLRPNQALAGDRAMARPIRIEGGGVLRVVEPAGARTEAWFAYQAPGEPRLAALEEAYGLEDVAGSGPTFRRALRLAAWFRGRVTYGPNATDPGRLGADGILQRAAKGERFPCGALCVAFLQGLQAVGAEGRILNVAWRPGYDHVVAEVWLHEEARWALIDVDNTAWYATEQGPASALDVHERLLAGRPVELHLGPPQATKAPDLEPEGKRPFYHHLSIKMRNDWFQTPAYRPWHPRGTVVWGDLEWADERTRPRVDRALVTRSRAEFEWIPGSVSLQGARAARQGSKVDVRWDHARARWPRSGSITVDGQVHPDGTPLRVEGSAEVRALGPDGTPGPATWLEVVP